MILASFENRHSAEHMLASLGRGFRKKHRKGHATALVIHGNKDGSLTLTHSRVLSIRGLVHTITHLAWSWTIGFIGITTMLRGTKGAAHQVREHSRTSDRMSNRVHQVLAQVGPDAALILVRCDDQETRLAVAHEQPTAQAKVGMAREQSSSPASIPAAGMTGCARLSASPPDRHSVACASVESEKSGIKTAL